MRPRVLFGRASSSGHSEPEAVVRAAEAVALRELEDVDVDLATWRQAVAQDAAHARERYARLRTEVLLRDLDRHTAPIFAADLEDRVRVAREFPLRVAALQTSDDGRRRYHEALDAATRGALPLALWYYGAIVAIVLVALGLASL